MMVKTICYHNVEMTILLKEFVSCKGVAKIATTLDEPRLKPFILSRSGRKGNWGLARIIKNLSARLNAAGSDGQEGSEREPIHMNGATEPPADTAIRVRSHIRGFLVRFRKYPANPSCLS